MMGVLQNWFAAATGFDVDIAVIGALQALGLGYLAYRSNRNGKRAKGVQQTLDTQVTQSLLATQTAVQEVTQEVFHARQDHNALAHKIDEVHVTVHAVRGELAALTERLDAHLGDNSSQ